MHALDLIILFIYFILLIVSAWTDYKCGKIYNKNILIFLGIYLLIYVIEYIVLMFTSKGEIQLLNAKLLNSFIGFVVSFLIGFIFYILGIFKGGDSKLLAVVGLVAGINNLFEHFAIIMIVAGVAALYVLIKNKIFLKRLNRVVLYFKTLFLTMSFQKYTNENDNVKFPFAVYVLIGEIISYFYLYLRR